MAQKAYVLDALQGQKRTAASCFQPATPMPDKLLRRTLSVLLR